MRLHFLTDGEIVLTSHANSVPRAQRGLDQLEGRGPLRDATSNVVSATGRTNQMLSRDARDRRRPGLAHDCRQLGVQDVDHRLHP